MLSYIQRKKCLPGTWFIQLDNTVKYVFGILFVNTEFCFLVPFPGCVRFDHFLGDVCLFRLFCQGKQEQICPCFPEVSG